MVGQVTNFQGASEILGTTDLWDANYHIIAAENTAQMLCDLQISHLVGDLRFQSPSGKDRLKIVDGAVDPQQLRTMRVLTPESALLLQGVLASQIETPVSLPGELPDDTPLMEGAMRQVSVNAYERNPEARRRCIKHYGSKCCICGFDFEIVYGEVAGGFIHIHHLRPLSEIGVEYVIDPVADLRPVCPNCHAVLHLRTPAHGIEEVKVFLAKRHSPKSAHIKDG